MKRFLVISGRRLQFVICATGGSGLGRAGSAQVADLEIAGYAGQVTDFGGAMAEVGLLVGRTLVPTEDGVRGGVSAASTWSES